MTATVNIKLFAPVARATNAIYMYVVDDAIATITTDGYFDNKQLSGSVKKGDIILVNSLAASGGGLAILLVSAVSATAGTIDVTTAFPVAE